MKQKIILFCFVHTFITGIHSQNFTYPFYQLYQLDSIASSPGIARHFGKLYSDFLRLIEKRLEKADTGTTRLLRHFESVFAQFYIDAANEHKNHYAISHPSWKKYFEDSSLSAAQYYLLGANAHLNGQLSEAIFNSYTPAEWKHLKKRYSLFNKCLNQTYRHVYHQTIYDHPRARILHLVTMGLDKPLGNYFLYKWRKRQMRVTEYRFKESEKHKKLFEKIQRKKAAVDRLIIIQLQEKSARKRLIAKF